MLTSISACGNLSGERVNLVRLDGLSYREEKINAHLYSVKVILVIDPFIETKGTLSRLRCIEQATGHLCRERF